MWAGDHKPWLRAFFCTLACCAEARIVSSAVREWSSWWPWIQISLLQAAWLFVSFRGHHGSLYPWFNEYEMWTLEFIVTLTYLLGLWCHVSSVQIVCFVSVWFEGFRSFIQHFNLQVTCFVQWCGGFMIDMSMSYAKFVTGRVEYVGGGSGSLSALSEKELEQVFFVATGLSPKVSPADLICSSKKQLQLG